MDGDPLPPNIAFGEFSLDSHGYLLRDRSGIVELEGRAFDVLMYLIRNRDRVVPKDELLEGIWAEQVVGESTLTRIISLLRRALRDSVGEPRYLQTLRGRGYRFIAEIRAVDGSTDSRLGDVSEPKLPRGLVGRVQELEQADVELRRALSGELRLIWLQGPAGIGKTRFGAVLADAAAAAGAQVLAARCDPNTGVPPFWPWTQLLRDLLAGFSAAERSDLWCPLAADLSQLVPEQGDADDTLGRATAGAGRSRVDAEESRFRLFDSVVRLLRGVAERRPLAICVDDVHWADAPSLLLLEFVARHLERSPILVLASFRTGGALEEVPFAQARTRIAANASLDLELGPLAPGEAVAFLLEHAQTHVAPETAAALHARAGGNPLFMRHLANSLRSLCTPSEWERALREIRAPDTVLEAVRQDLARLSPEALGVLRVAAVTGREFDLALVRQGVEAPPDAVLQAVEEALRNRLIESSGPARERFRFVHPLIFEALYESLPIDQRAFAHLRVARALARHAEVPNLASSLAHHYWLARVVAPPEQVRSAQLDAAREALRALSFEEAARLAQRALEVAAPWESVDAQFDVLFLIAEAYHLRGEDQGMREWCFRAARQARSLGRHDLMARAALGFFGVGGIGRLDGAWVSLAEETLEALADAEPELRARLLMQLALEYYWAGYTERGLRLSAQAEAMARKLEDPGAVAAALDLRLSLLRHPDELPSVLERVDEILDILPARSNPEIEMRIRLVRHDVLLEQVRLSEARIEARRVVRLAEELRLLWPLRVRLLYDLMEGRHAAVERFIEDAIRSGRIDFSTSGEWAQNFMVVFYHLRFQQERLVELLPMIAEWASRFPAFPGVRIGLAQAHVQAGQLEEARDLVRDLARNDYEDFPRDQVWLWFMVSLAEVSVIAGTRSQLDRLWRLLWSYRDRVALIASDACLGSVARVLGLIAGATGRPDSAIRCLEEALSVDAKLGSFLFARTALDLCRAHLSRGLAADRQRARAVAESVVDRLRLESEPAARTQDWETWIERARTVISST